MRCLVTNRLRLCVRRFIISTSAPKNMRLKNKQSRVSFFKSKNVPYFVIVKIHKFLDPLTPPVYFSFLEEGSESPWNSTSSPKSISLWVTELGLGPSSFPNLYLDRHQTPPCSGTVYLGSSTNNEKNENIELTEQSRKKNIFPCYAFEMVCAPSYFSHSFMDHKYIWIVCIGQLASFPSVGKIHIH